MGNPRFRPLRIKTDPDEAFTVIICNRQEECCEDTIRIQSGTAIAPFGYLGHLFDNCKYLFEQLKTSTYGHVSIFPYASVNTYHRTIGNLATKIPDINQTQQDIRDLVRNGHSPSLQYLVDTCISLYKLYDSIVHDSRHEVRKLAVNLLYFYSILILEMERKKKNKTEAKFDEAYRELVDLQQKMPEWDHQNTCWNTLYAVDFTSNFTAPRLFIVLPTDLDFWNVSDLSTHRFRLYYLCDNWKPREVLGDLPQHVHLSDHPGYNVSRPQEFFQIYGDYVLRVLRMIKGGYSDNIYKIPPLNACNSLWNCDPNAFGNHLTEQTIGDLVDLTIAYLKRLNLPEWISDYAIDRFQSAAVKSHLDVQVGDTANGNLHRCVDPIHFTFWKCQEHAQQHLLSESLESLREFVYSHRGNIDMKQAILRVELSSTAEADRFRTLLTGAKCAFDIALKLSWEVTRSHVNELCQEIATTGTKVLEIDGITPDIHPKSLGYYLFNMFASKVREKSGILVLTLLNYPRPQEQCIHSNTVSIHSTIPTVRGNPDLLELNDTLQKAFKAMSDMFDGGSGKATGTFETLAMQIDSAVEKCGLSDLVFTTTMHFEPFCEAVIDLKTGGFIEMCSIEIAYREFTRFTGALRKLVLDLSDVEFDQELFSMVQTNSGLQELVVSYHGHNALYHADQVVMKWHRSSSPFCLTLVERMHDTRSRVVARLAISMGAIDSSIEAQDVTINPPFSQQPAMDALLDIQLSRWDCDHVSGRLSDYSTAFLDIAAQQHPSVLALFTLDVSGLSSIGLGSLEKVLCRSNLEHLNIVCTLVKPNLSEYIAKVLGSVQWPSLNSLVFSGSHINEWLQLWPSHVDARLFHLQLQGTWPVCQELCHSSILFLRQLISSSPLVELNLRCVQLQDEHDWLLIVESMDLSQLRILDAGSVITRQLFSSAYAVDLLVSKMEAAHWHTKAVKLILPGLLLDVANLSEERLLTVQKFVSFCTIQELYVECRPFQQRVSNSIAQVLASVPWSTLERLELLADNIDGWIQLLNPIAAPRLKLLLFWGSKSPPEVLSPSSVRLVQQLTSVNLLMELCFEDILLQDQQDWVIMVRSLDPTRLKTLGLYGKSHSQFRSTADAVNLRNSRLSDASEDREDEVNE